MNKFSTCTHSLTLCCRPHTAAATEGARTHTFYTFFMCAGVVVRARTLSMWYTQSQVANAAEKHIETLLAVEGKLALHESQLCSDIQIGCEVAYRKIMRANTISNTIQTPFDRIKRTPCSSTSTNNTTTTTISTDSAKLSNSILKFEC